MLKCVPKWVPPPRPLQALQAFVLAAAQDNNGGSSSSQDEEGEGQESSLVLPGVRHADGYRRYEVRAGKQEGGL